MRESGDGRDTVFPWSHAYDAGGFAGAVVPIEPAPTPYAVGDVVYSGNSLEPGTVVSLDRHNNTISVEWSDATYGEIVYAADATFLRKAFPWE